MTARRTLPDRRHAETTTFRFDNIDFVLTIGRFRNGDIGELFLNTGSKLNSTADINAQDAAVAASIAIQYGCPVDVLRKAMKRKEDGSPQGALGAALDKIVDDGSERRR
jgi:ribonucleoside-diphosphate reductase alpha chain